MASSSNESSGDLVTAPPLLDVPSLLARLAAQGDRPALTFYRGKTLDARLTYRELGASVAALAAALHGGGVRPGDRVAVLSPNRLEIPVLVLALLRLGAVVVPLNPGSAVDDWTYILEHSGARGLCATRELVERVPPDKRPGFVLHVEEAFARGNAGGMAEAPGDPVALAESMAVVLYTSGTTGNPKGVALRQSSLLSNAWSMAHNFGLRQTAQLAVLPLYHAHAFGFGLMTALATAGHLVFTERLEPFTWAEVVRREAIEVTSVVPTLLPMLLAAGVTREKVPTLRHILVSSAPLPVELARDFEARTRIPLIQGWGLSEYTNFACCIAPDGSPEEHTQLLFGWEVPSIGPALEGSEVRVVDGAGVSVDEGERGELVIRGHSTMLGYFRDPENTARTIDEGGWLHTGDEGFFRLHGGRPIFFVTGRLKEIIIRDAEKYSPLRLERRLLECVPELSGRLVVLGFPQREHGEEVGAYIETNDLDDATRSRLEAALDAMPVPERAKVILYGAAPIPRTHTGKIQRRKMLPWFAPWAEHRGARVIQRI
jgi:long-chain acyl-CoA synthetase